MYITRRFRGRIRHQLQFEGADKYSLLQYCIRFIRVIGCRPATMPFLILATINVLHCFELGNVCSNERHVSRLVVGLVGGGGYVRCSKCTYVVVRPLSSLQLSCHGPGTSPAQGLSSSCRRSSLREMSCALLLGLCQEPAICHLVDELHS